MDAAIRYFHAAVTENPGSLKASFWAEFNAFFRAIGHLDVYRDRAATAARSCWKPGYVPFPTNLPVFPEEAPQRFDGANASPEPVRPNLDNLPDFPDD